MPSLHFFLKTKCKPGSLLGLYPLLPVITKLTLIPPLFGSNPCQRQIDSKNDAILRVMASRAALFSPKQTPS